MSQLKYFSTQTSLQNTQRKVTSVMDSASNFAKKIDELYFAMNYSAAATWDSYLAGRGGGATTAVSAVHHSSSTASLGQPERTSVKEDPSLYGSHREVSHCA